MWKPRDNRCQHSENTANQIMPKKVSVLKQVRLTDENHSALIKVKTQAIMPTSLGSLANCAITIALPQLQERFCKTCNLPKELDRTLQDFIDRQKKQPTTKG